MSFDLAIVGGGPAGLATAIFAAQRGLSSVVLDRRELPLDKPCGEGLMPPGVRLLQEMGVVLPPGSYTPFSGIRYVDGQGEASAKTRGESDPAAARALIAEGRFRTGPGWGIRRTVLIEGMVRRALELGCVLRYGVGAGQWHVKADGSVQVDTHAGPVRARWLIGADGLHSRIRRDAGLDISSPGPARYGTRRHFKIRPWSSSLVEVQWTDGAEAYLTPVGSQEMGVAFLCSGKATRFALLLERFPDLKGRLSAAPLLSEERGAGPFRQAVRCRYRGPVALVGDAAGYLDALTGEGMSLGFRCAKALVEVLAQGGALPSYETAYRRLSRPYYVMTRLLLAISGRPGLRRRVMAALAQNPKLFDRLLAMSTGEESLHCQAFVSLALEAAAPFRSG
ncbi:MAG: NAD(P)/FAD-dependent oxidoreductase [Acidobacteriota bacterium]